jgi:hypothetical protein
MGLGILRGRAYMRMIVYRENLQLNKGVEPRGRGLVYLTFPKFYLR